MNVQEAKDIIEMYKTIVEKKGVSFLSAEQQTEYNTAIATLNTNERQANVANAVEDRIAYQNEQEAKLNQLKGWVDNYSATIKKDMDRYAALGVLAHFGSLKPEERAEYQELQKRVKKFTENVLDSRTTNMTSLKGKSYEDVRATILRAISKAEGEIQKAKYRQVDAEWSHNTQKVSDEGDFIFATQQKIGKLKNALEELERRGSIEYYSNVITPEKNVQENQVTNNINKPEPTVNQTTDFDLPPIPESLNQTNSTSELTPEEIQAMFISNKATQVAEPEPVATEQLEAEEQQSQNTQATSNTIEFTAPVPEPTPAPVPEPSKEEPFLKFNLEPLKRRVTSIKQSKALPKIVGAAALAIAGIAAVLNPAILGGFAGGLAAVYGGSEMYKGYRGK